MRLTNIRFPDRHVDPATSFTTDQLDAVAASGRLLSFPPTLEAAFQEEDRTERVRHYVRSGLVALVLYDLFLIVDWQLIPDMFAEACIVRLAIFSPLLLLTLWRIARTNSVFEREAISATMAVVAFGLVLVLESNSLSPYRPQYHYGVLLIMVFTTVAQRLRFHFAVAANAGMVALRLTPVLLSNQADQASRLADLSFFPTAAVLLCVASYALDRERRLNFLSRMKAHSLNAELERVSKIDPLTGLWNRRHLTLLMATAWSHAEPSECMAAIVIDVDHFKAFNDRYGHPAGDACLEKIGACLGQAALPHNGAAVRYGGEEFLLFLPGIDEPRAITIGEELRQAVHNLAIPNQVDDGGYGLVTVSIGVAAGLVATATSETMINAADKALYTAKRDGRDRVRAASGADMVPLAAAA